MSAIADPTADYVATLADYKAAQARMDAAGARMMAEQCRREYRNVEHPTKSGYRLRSECTLMRGHEGDCGKHPLLR